MSNLQIIREKDVTLNVDGNDYKLRFDLNSLATLEENFGSLGDIHKKLNEGSILTLRKVLWASLLCNHPEITEKEVGSFVNFVNIQTVQKAINLALGQSFPEQDVQENESVGEQGKNEQIQTQE